MSTTTDILTLDAQHPVVSRLIELQGTASDAQFAKRWLTCSASSWSRIKAGSYHAADPARMADKLEGSLAALEDARASGAGSIDDIVPLRLIRQGIAAVKRAFGEPRDRLVVVLAATGGGKTTLARAISETYHGRVISAEASETWRSSYLAATHALMRAAGIRDLPHSTRLAEVALIDHLRAAPRLIVIDEAHYFGPATINLVKAILNQTSSAVVLLAIPALWERTKQAAWDEAEQLRSRTCALVRAEEVDQHDIDSYLRHRLNGSWTSLPDSDRSSAISLVGATANRFGRLATVARVAAELEVEIGDRAATTSDIDAAINTVKLLRA